MNKGIVASLATLLTSAGLALPAEPAAPATAPPPLAVVEPIAHEPDLSGVPHGSADDAPHNRIWASAEYLMGWLKSAPAPVPLAGNVSTPQVFVAPGFFVPPQVVLGGTPIDSGFHQGARFTLGGWIDCQKTFGVESSYFFLTQTTRTQTVGTPPGNNAQVIPFIDPTGLTTLTGNPGPSYVNPIQGFGGTPGGFFLIPTNSIASLTTSTRLQGGELNGLANLASNGALRLDLIGGFRYLQLEEDLDYTNSSSFIFDPGTSLTTTDHFGTQNRFYGGQLGARAEYDTCGFSVAVTGKVALGVTHESVSIAGSSLALTDFPGLTPVITSRAGFFAQPTNINHYSRDQFAVVPEVGINVGYDITSWARVYVGYTFMYMSDVVRPGNQINPSVNPSQTLAFAPFGAPPGPLVGPAQPAFAFHSSDFYAQTINFGLLFRY